jgi:poly(hydroxyalkanoate) depolymerase family esterase
MRNLLHLARLLPALSTLTAVGCAVAGPPDGAPEDEQLGVVASAAVTDLVEVTGFGSNPGALKMWKHIPPAVKPSPATVVVLHGCTQGAVDASKTGWNELSEKYGFVVVYPEQQTANNAVRCFNWSGEYGDATNLQRGKGENLSIKQMVDKALADHGGDPKKVYVAGFSAGAAEAVLMASVFPDVFAAAASVAGIPYDCTTVYAEVSTCQKPGKSLAADVWSKKVKDAFPGFTGPWPRMSVWQGDADTVVGTANRGEILKQWTDLHGLSGAAPTGTETVDGQKRSLWKDASGAVKVETYVIAGMGHGVPIKGGADCGSASTYTLDKGICASARIAEFFGLTGAAAPGASSGAPDGGASSGKPSASSSSSSSSGSAGGDGGAPSSGAGGTTNGAAPGDTGYGHAESTCNVAGGVGRAGEGRALPTLAFAGLAGLAVRRRRAAKPRA